MTKQYLRELKTVEIGGCKGCRYYKRDEIFQFCTHEASKYKVQFEEYHTCQHMRDEHGPCGREMKLHL